MNGQLNSNIYNASNNEADIEELQKQIDSLNTSVGSISEKVDKTTEALNEYKAENNNHISTAEIISTSATVDNLSSNTINGTTLCINGTSNQKDINKYEIFKELLPQDLLKFGLIPEFIGRLPIIATLEDLDKEALIKILVEPKNSLVKQYQKLFEIDGVELVFEREALEAIVDKAIERKTGARGLRSIIEDIMRDIMFEIPSNPNIEKCIITKETVINKKEPELVINELKNERKQKEKKKRQTPNKETA